MSIKQFSQDFKWSLQMNTSFNYITIASCFILGMALAYAESDSFHGNMPDKVFNAMDTNSDGRVTRIEFDDFGAKKFRDMDTNGNGEIILDEMKAEYKKMMGGERKKIDGNEMNVIDKMRSQKDNTNSKSETMAAGSFRHSCCWTPGE